MMTYNYEVEVKKDVKEYITENYTVDEIVNDDIADVMDEIVEACWIADSVTGNASGSYTFNRWIAEENLLHNSELLLDACDNFGYEYSYIGEMIAEGNFETLDVLIRCYLVSGAVYEVVDEIMASHFSN